MLCSKSVRPYRTWVVSIPYCNEERETANGLSGSSAIGTVPSLRTIHRTVYHFIVFKRAVENMKRYIMSK